MRCSLLFLTRTLYKNNQLIANLASQFQAGQWVYSLNFGTLSQDNGTPSLHFGTEGLGAGLIPNISGRRPMISGQSRVCHGVFPMISGQRPNKSGQCPNNLGRTVSFKNDISKLFRKLESKDKSHGCELCAIETSGKL